MEVLKQYGIVILLLQNNDRVPQYASFYYDSEAAKSLEGGHKSLKCVILMTDTKHVRLLKLREKEQTMTLLELSNCGIQMSDIIECNVQTPDESVLSNNENIQQSCNNPPNDSVFSNNSSKHQNSVPPTDLVSLNGGSVPNASFISGSESTLEVDDNFSQCTVSTVGPRKIISPSDLEIRSLAANVPINDDSYRTIDMCACSTGKKKKKNLSKRLHYKTYKCKGTSIINLQRCGKKDENSCCFCCDCFLCNRRVDKYKKDILSSSPKIDTNISDTSLINEITSVASPLLSTAFHSENHNRTLTSDVMTNDVFTDDLQNMNERLVPLFFYTNMCIYKSM
jgi:hypothetical protein